MGLDNLDNLVKTNKLKVEPFDQGEFDGLVKLTSHLSSLLSLPHVTVGPKASLIKNL